MENLIGVGNNRKIPFNPMILEKTEVTFSEPLHRDRPDLGNIFNLYMFEQ